MFIRIFPRYGLSPLARGTLTTRLPVVSSMRFIPAGAGNTSSVPSNSRCKTVYPRWRGEHVSGRGSSRMGRGLSPLARGTRLLEYLAGAAFRFIPAGAGNTESYAKKFGWEPVYPRWRGEHIAGPV